MITIYTTPRFYIGVDTHKFTHTACVINYDTDILLTFTFKNQPSAFSEVLHKILEVTRCKDIIFGLEDTQSFGFHFSHYLTSIGFTVKQVNPAFANAYRASLPNYHKSDDFDSFCVAKVLKDSYKQLPSFHHEQIYSHIRLLVGQRSILTKQQSINYITLHQQLSKVYPGYTQFFSTIHTRSALAFFLHFPSPRYLKNYTKELLTEEMKQYTRIFKESKAEYILEIVRANPTGYQDTLVEEVIVQLIEDIYTREERIIKLEKQLEPLLEQTGYKLQTIPGVSIATAAKLISEIGDIRRFKSERQLAKFCGIAPVTIGSGGKNITEHSKGGNRELRSTFYFLAVGMITVNKDDKARHPLFREYFLRKIGEGKTKSQALICIMRQLVRIIYAMMKNKSEWKPPEK